ncbi:hypothetical protein GQ44DRAFT_830040 [Phaeosphaeriaceae sp. PMI808]|nr:hypothetical protein GQ44DRAFT_830040 [Phaeosphaeriaceae sp. PMI808]
MVAGKDGKDSRISLVSKVQWVIFQKRKIHVLRAAIEAYKSNIALMLGTLNMAEKVSRRLSAPQLADIAAQEAQEQAVLQGLELDSRSSLLNPEQAEREVGEYVAQPLTEGSSFLTPSLLETMDIKDGEPFKTTLV